MSETPGGKKIFSLLEVTLSVQKTLLEHYSGSYWIKAEMNKLNRYPHSGHCYPELVEKKEGKLVAQMKGTIWKNDYDAINKNFIKVTCEPVKDGISILFLAKISFDPVHGLSLRILDIDPTYTLGELEKEKQLTIEKMKKEGIFDANKSLRFPLLPKRIAVISVETSKGYSDFLKMIDENDWNYRFFHLLFPAFLQGENAVTSISSRLQQIARVIEHFDVVAIIRGGGGDVGLSCFNDYSLSRQVALFPIPVLTGIGHATNETVVEMVAYINGITPTELADFLVQKFHDFAIPVIEAEKKTGEWTERIINDEKKVIIEQARILRHITQLALSGHKTAMEKYSGLLMAGVKNFVFKERIKTEILEKQIELLDPVNVLKRGYSITRFKNALLKSIDQVTPGDEIETVVIDGRIVSTIKETHKDQNQ